MHDFFLERDYPAATELSRVAAVLTADYQMPDILRQRLKMDVETFDKAVEKLTAQGAASIDMAGNVRNTGLTTWRSGYDAQLAFRRSQIDRMAAFAETPQCRMAALIQHFGDTADGLRPCGHCDFCSPERATAQTFRAPTTLEDRQLRTILSTLATTQSKSTGKLHTDLALGPLNGIARKQFDAYLDSLARAGLLSLTTDTFTNPEGNLISYKKASLTHEGRTLKNSDALEIHLKDADTPTPTKSRTKSTRSKTKASHEEDTPFTPEQRDLEARIREWRKAEAAKTGKPAFIVFSDAILRSVVQTRPRTIPSLLQISGIGPEKADRYGAAICALCDSRPTPGEYGEAPSARSVRPTPMKQKKLAIKLPTQTTRTDHAAPAPTETFHRARPTAPEPTESLTPAQQALDHRLREWRRTESEKLNLPQFFVLGSSALRDIVLKRPQNAAQLKAINGINQEKLEQFGRAILEACTT
jgi:ATP-dependent DNA helicase RecQ